MTPKIIRANGKIEEVEPKNGTDFSLEEVQKIVGGFVEEVRLYNNNLLILIDEEGKLKEKPFNMLATAITRGTIADDDHIVGDVLICDTKFFK